MSNLLIPEERKILVAIIDTLWNIREPQRVCMAVKVPHGGVFAGGTCRDLSNRLREAFGMKTNHEGGVPVEEYESSVRKDQAAVVRHAAQGGMRSVPVFARAFGISLNEVERIMREAGVLNPPPEEPESVKGYAVVLEQDLKDEEDMRWIHGLLLQVKGVKEVVPLESEPGDQVTTERIRHELFEKVHRAFFPKKSL